jgi:gas vesicle protein
MNNGKLVLGVLAGIAAGALAGVLFAPEKGAVTRKKIMDTGGDYAKGLKDKFNELYQGGAEKAESLKKEAKSGIA